MNQDFNTAKSYTCVYFMMSFDKEHVKLASWSMSTILRFHIDCMSYIHESYLHPIQTGLYSNKKKQKCIYVITDCDTHRVLNIQQDYISLHKILYFRNWINIMS